MSPDRTKRFNMVISEEEDVMLRELAEANHTTVSDYVRTFVRREHERLVAVEDAVMGALARHADKKNYLTVDGLRVALAKEGIDTSRLRETLARLEAAKRIQLGGRNTIRLAPT